MQLPTTLFGLGSFFLIIGVLCILVGSGIIKINPDKIPFVIQHGKATCIIGTILVLVGGVFLSKSPGNIVSSTDKKEIELREAYSQGYEDGLRERQMRMFEQ